MYYRLKMPTMDKKKIWTLCSTTSLSLMDNLCTLRRHLSLCTSKADRNKNRRKLAAWVTWRRSPQISLPCHCYWRCPSCSSPGRRRRRTRCSPRLWLQGRCRLTVPASLLLRTQTRLKFASELWQEQAHRKEKTSCVENLFVFLKIYIFKRL